LVVTVQAGTPQNDKLNGTSGVYMLFGMDVRNTLNSGDGNSLLNGNNDDDTFNTDRVAGK
jgi:Ca2+-binding RTX toxin-like protein